MEICQNASTSARVPSSEYAEWVDSDSAESESANPHEQSLHQAVPSATLESPEPSQSPLRDLASLASLQCFICLETEESSDGELIPRETIGNFVHACDCVLVATSYVYWSG